jgi:hypothetical protein
MPEKEKKSKDQMIVRTSQIKPTPTKSATAKTKTAQKTVKKKSAVEGKQVRKSLACKKRKK